MSESARADEALATGAKPTARRRHDVALLQNLGEHIPARPAREPDPNVGSVDAPVHGEAHPLERLAEDRCVFLVKGHEVGHLLESLVGQAREPTGLRDRARAVEDRRHDPVEVVDDGRTARVLQLRRDHRPTQADAREARILRERTRLDRALFGSRDLEDRPRAVRVFDVEGIGRVVDDDRAVFACERDEFFELLTGRRGARGVVRGAEEDEVGALRLRDFFF